MTQDWSNLSNGFRVSKLQIKNNNNRIYTLAHLLVSVAVSLLGPGLYGLQETPTWFSSVLQRASAAPGNSPLALSHRQPPSLGIRSPRDTKQQVQYT